MREENSPRRMTESNEISLLSVILRGEKRYYKNRRTGCCAGFFQHWFAEPVCQCRRTPRRAERFTAA